ncbi:MAG: DNA polymerase III subunit gamma/tau [Clostridia bacterium]|nr:DNA polymerase III subunit gamma/tau [Clostridia bacterium]
MSQYQALYRQWRPRTFAEVAGQEHITRTLRHAVRDGLLVHAYLFCGPRGTGKTSTARILAKAINCRSSQEGEPCNECPNCKRIDSGNSLDVLEIDAASNRGIDEVRDLIEKIALGAVEGKYKVYIIDEVHMLTTEAFNAILKTLEEPPEHVVFILATTEPRKVLPTILSRCQRFDFHSLDVATITRRLHEVATANGVQIETAALNLLARKAGGAMRDALGLLDQVLAGSSQEVITANYAAAILGMAQLDTLLRLVGALAENDGAELLRLLDSSLSSGVEPRQLVDDLLDYTRNLLLLQMDPGAGEYTGLLPEEVQQVAAQAQKINKRRLLDLMERLQQCGAALRWSNQPRILLEMTLVGFIVAPAPALEDLSRRVEALEKRLLELTARGTHGEKQQAAGADKFTAAGRAARAQEGAGVLPSPTTGAAQQTGSLSAKSRDVRKTSTTQAAVDSQHLGVQREKSPGAGKQTKATGPAGRAGARLSAATAKAEPVAAPAAAGQQVGFKAETDRGNESNAGAGVASAGQKLPFAVVQARWGEVLTAARRESIHLQAYLREAEPVAVDGDRVEVVVKTDFHRGMLEQPANRRKVEAVLERVFGLTLKLVINANKQSQTGPDQEVIESMKEYFGPEKVEIID